jgi:O-antigen/teichoic acid export membrane protein
LLRRLLRFSRPEIPSVILFALSTRYLDAMFIAHWFSHATLGVYTVVYQVAGLTQQVPTLAGYLLMPLLMSLQADRREDSAVRFLHEVLPPLTLCWTLGCALVAVSGASVLPWLFGPEFDDAGALLWPLMVASAFAGPLTMGYTPIATARARTYVTMIGIVASGCVNLLLNWLLIPRLGLIGCAWATAAAYSVACVAVFLTVHGRETARRPWTLEATCPIVLGAVWASAFGGALGALGVTALAAAVIAGVHRGPVRAAARTLRHVARSVA